MFYWIYDYPTWGMGVSFGVAFVAVTWLATFLARPTIRLWIHTEKRANDMVGLGLSSFSTFFGLMLGLLSVASYQNYSNVNDLVDKEAASIAALYRDFSAYPEPIRGKLEERLREYARYVIEDGWPQQRRGVAPRGEVERITTLFETLSVFEPSKKNQEILHEETLRQFNHLVEARRARVANVTIGLPAVFWWVVAFGSLLNIVLIAILDMEVHVHVILGGVLAAFLGVVIYLIAELDNPFRGAVSIGPEAIELVYKTVMQPR